MHSFQELAFVFTAPSGPDIRSATRSALPMSSRASETAAPNDWGRVLSCALVAAILIFVARFARSAMAGAPTGQPVPTLDYAEGGLRVLADVFVGFA